jgi:hypothetical protein
LLGAGATTAAALFYLAFAGPLTPFMLVVWFAAFGFFTAFGPLLIAHGKALSRSTRSDAASLSSTWAPRAARSWSRPLADS